MFGGRGALGGMRIGVKVLDRKQEVMCLLEGFSHRWEDDTKINLKDVMCDGLDWIHTVQDRAGFCELGNECLSSIETS
jgi:hypothetical protein